MVFVSFGEDTRSHLYPIFPSPLGPMILWMDEMLHHPRSPGLVIPPANFNKRWFQPWFQSGAKWISSIHSIVVHMNRRDMFLGAWLKGGMSGPESCARATTPLPQEAVYDLQPLRPGGKKPINTCLEMAGHAALHGKTQALC